MRVIEQAAKASFEAFCGNTPLLPWEQLPNGERPRWIAAVEAALKAYRVDVEFFQKTVDACDQGFWAKPEECVGLLPPGQYITKSPSPPPLPDDGPIYGADMIPVLRKMAAETNDPAIRSLMQRRIESHCQPDDLWNRKIMQPIKTPGMIEKLSDLGIKVNGIPVQYVSELPGGYEVDFQSMTLVPYEGHRMVPPIDEVQPDAIVAAPPAE